MNKIWLITQREFLTRIRKRSFIIMSILGPIIIAVFFASMFYIATFQDVEVKKIAVLDSTGVFIKRIPDTKYIHFEYLNIKLESLKKTFKTTDYYGILYISPIIAYSARGVQFYSYQQPSLNITQHISAAIEKELRDQKLLASKIQNIRAILKSVETKVDIETIKLTGQGEEKTKNSTVAMVVAYIGSLLIYMFILLFGVQVMRAVIEEKSSRIVEVIISSVKPFQLMMGKVLGVALTAMMQFAIWIVLSIIFVTLIKASFMPDLAPVNIANQPQNLMEVSKSMPLVQPQTPQLNPELADAFSTIDSINFYVMIGSFLFYFIGGYLLYASLFAAVGAAVDNDTDTQQFVFPLTTPLVIGIGIMIMIGVFQNPNSSIAFWFSMIPFTSPIVMMARIPFGVPYEQVVVSMALLVITFISAIWLAGKIYRTGILMYGNKASFKLIIKWLKYKN